MSKDGSISMKQTIQQKSHTYLNYTLLAYALLLPLSRAAIVLLSFIMILLWITEGNFAEKKRLLLQSKIILALSVFLIYNFVSIVWSDSPLNAFSYVIKYWYFFPLVIFYTSLKKEYISKALSFFIIGMFISEIISYGIFFGLWHYKNILPQNPTPFMHHIEYSVFLAFTSLVLLTRIFNIDEWKTKIVYSLFFITMTGNLFLTAGRTGQLAFLIGLFVAAIASFKNKVKAFTIFTLLATTIFLLAFQYSHTFHDRIEAAGKSLLHLEAKGGYCTSWGSRIGAWDVSKDIIADNPVIGVGIDDNMKTFYQLVNTKYAQMICPGNTLVHMHDQYLQILTQTGIIGLLLLLLIFYTIGTLPIKDVLYQRIKYIYLSVILFAFVSDVLMHRQFSMALFAFVVGLLLTQYRVEHET